MHDYFTENIEAPASRSVLAIRHRWLSIQKAVAARKEQTKVELLKAEAHFMGQDLDKLSPHMKEYYISVQREILERHGIRGPTPPSS